MAVDFSGQISRNRKVLVPDDKCRRNDKYDSCGDGKNIIREFSWFARIWNIFINNL